MTPKDRKCMNGSDNEIIKESLTLPDVRKAILQTSRISLSSGVADFSRDVKSRGSAEPWPGSLRSYLKKRKHE